jgi:hypothetical protein
LELIESLRLAFEEANIESPFMEANASVFVIIRIMEQSG